MVDQIEAAIKRLNESTQNLENVKAVDGVRNGDHYSAPLPEVKAYHKPCTRCRAAEGMWKLRAGQMFVCEECRKIVEYRTEEEFDAATRRTRY